MSTMRRIRAAIGDVKLIDALPVAFAVSTAAGGGAALLGFWLAQPSVELADVLSALAGGAFGVGLGGLLLLYRLIR